MIILAYALLVVGLMGIIAGLILAYASKKFAVWVDQKTIQIEEVLPGLNCGACGYAGCHAYALAVTGGKAEPNLCKPGGPKVATEIGNILGETVEKKEQLVSQRYCSGGGMEAKRKFEYHGLETCKSASLVNNGFNVCAYSCLGLGDCAKVCPVNAIIIDANGLPAIDREKCIGCEQCVKECPRNILHMAPRKAMVHVRCSSKDSAKVVMKACTVGCIACRLCEKNCPVDAIHVIDNLAVIDYSKCINCGKCAEVCPRKIIDMGEKPPEEAPKGEEPAKENEEKAQKDSPEQEKST
jgi:Na+-translocating ferredoxin:NAD+ oxidoreductase RNF subunit RnfB